MERTIGELKLLRRLRYLERPGPLVPGEVKTNLDLDLGPNSNLDLNANRGANLDKVLDPSPDMYS